MAWDMDAEEQKVRYVLYMHAFRGVWNVSMKRVYPLDLVYVYECSLEHKVCINVHTCVLFVAINLSCYRNALVLWAAGAGRVHAAVSQRAFGPSQRG